jgi:hypothetical protein
MLVGEHDARHDHLFEDFDFEFEFKIAVHRESPVLRVARERLMFRVRLVAGSATVSRRA